MKLTILLIFALNVFSQITPNFVKIGSRQSKVIRFENTYTLSTTENLRDTTKKSRAIEPLKDDLRVDSDSNMFNALFSMAIDEVKENSVSRIYDSAFGSMRCDCFETGKKWNYVWTRDTAYSVNLSLAYVDPIRSMNSMLFKISNFRNQNNKTSQIVQDTGSGGSWPVSTDRVTWALGAIELIKYLPKREKEQFAKKAYIALKNTVDTDRKVVFDKRSGLYNGEQSFLDWREQTYPKWVLKNLTHIAMSKTLSTNIAHYIALKSLNELGKVVGKSNYKYEKFAEDLKDKINEKLWDRQKNLYSLMLTTHLDQTKVGKYDLLGNSLAILHGIAKSSNQNNLLENYSMSKLSAPVIFPQDKNAPIYHNRATWPFVSSYALLAAKRQKQALIYNHLFNSLIYGSALNLSNMENFEFLSLKNYVHDYEKSGPVLNSQRQLWSVAGFISSYVDGIFGKEVRDNSIRFNPFITHGIKTNLLSSSSSIELKNFNFKSKFIDVKINLPKKFKFNKNAYFLKTKTLLNGKLLQRDFISYKDLKTNNIIEIFMDKSELSSSRISISNSNIYSPQTPEIISFFKKNNKIKIQLKEFGTYNVYKNNKVFIKNMKADFFEDFVNETTACYSVELVKYGNHSYHSEPKCFWQNDYVQLLPLKGSFNVKKSADYLLQVEYENNGDLSTGITASVKKVKIYEASHLIKEAYLILPHSQGTRDSNFISLNLKKDTSYKVHLSDFFNMSYFDHFQTYIYRGGRSGEDNHAKLLSLKLLKM